MRLDLDQLVHRGSRSYVAIPRKLAALEQALRGRARGSAAGMKKTVLRRFESLDPHMVPDDLLLAVLLLGDVKGDPVEEARKLLASTAGDLEVALIELSEVSRARVRALEELQNRAEARRTQKPKILSAYDAANTLRPHVRPDRESLLAVYLTRAHQPLAVRVLTMGNDAHTIVDPRQIGREAIKLGATAVILAHNHPSGETAPSQADLEVTQRALNTLGPLGIEVLDHLVFDRTGRGFQSMRELGLMQPRAAQGWSEVTR